MDCRLATPKCQATFPSTISHSLFQFIYIESVMLSNHRILCHPPLLLPQCFPESESFPMSWLSASGDQSIGASTSAIILPMNIQGWFNLLAVQGTLKSLLHHHNLRPSVLQCTTFFTVQLSHIHSWLLEKPQHWFYIWTFFSKVMFLLFKRLPRFVMAFLPKRKHVLISWLQSPSAVIFGTQENKICHWFHFFPFYLP